MASIIDNMSSQDPSLLNPLALMGAAGGLLAGIGLPVPTALGLTLAGGCVGGVVGKKEIQAAHSEETGAATPPPSMLNKEALLGALIGIIAVRVITFGLVSYLGLAAAGATAAVATAVGGAMAVGLYLGGRYGKKCMETEYEQKMREQMSKMLESTIDPKIMPHLLGQGQSQVTPQEKAWTEEILRQKLAPKSHTIGHA